MSENQWGNRLFRDLKKDPLQLQEADLVDAFFARANLNKTNS